MSTTANQLRAELRAAHTIIRNALAVMTFDQKLEWANANERDDVIGEGVTRANERQAVIDDGSPLALFLELRRADLIIANAWGIQSFHQHALWTTANLQDGVAARHPTRADSRTLVLAAAVDSARELVGDARGSIADEIVGFVEGFGDVAPAESGAWCGLDAGDPAGDQAVLVIRSTCELSEAAVAEFRRVFHAAAQTNVVTFLVEQPAAAPSDDQIMELAAAEGFAVRDTGRAQWVLAGSEPVAGFLRIVRTVAARTRDLRPAAAPAESRAAFKAAFTEWCERFPEISSLARLGAAWNAARAFGSQPTAETNGEHR
ncbi:hypothetical protein DIE07_14425 [Burkholderia sp. Bp9002]|nr:hypothetical protein DIE07_14425 [Burkholderia sp. Bp9002]